VYFDNIALYFECRINKSALLQTVFLAIMPTGMLLFVKMNLAKERRKRPIRSCR